MSVRPLLRIALAALALAQAPVLLAQQAVTVAPLNALEVQSEAQASASVIALNQSVLSAEVSARVQRVLADTGDVVEAGALLLELDDGDYRLALQRAEAQLAAARARQSLGQQRLQRGRELAENGYASPDELLALMTEVELAAAEIRLAEVAIAGARRDLARTRVQAPFAGAVLRRHAQEGQLAAAGTPLLELIETGRLEVRAEVQATDAESLLAATELRFVGSEGSQALSLLRISPVVDAGSRTREARLTFVDAETLAGSQGRLVWLRSQGQVPASLVLRRGSELGVFLYDNGIARFHALPEAQEGRPVRLSLPGSTLVIVEGRNALADGDPVSRR